MASSPMKKLDPRISGLVMVAAVLAACGGTELATDAGVDGGDEGGTEADGSVPLRKCNGHEELCDRAFDSVAYPMTHNAMSNAAAGWLLPNQSFGLTRQLEDGIRGMMLDTYEEDGELVLCHVLCGAGSQLLVEGLGEIESFLRAHPDEVVSIIFENYITQAQTADAFEQSRLIDFVYTHRTGEPWPTLGGLIDDGTRLVAFQEKLPLDPEVPWLMNIWDNAWETPFSVSTPEGFVCSPNRGNPANPLFLLNHFLTGPFGGSPELAEMVNYDPLFIDRARQCEEESGDLLNFVAVDFYDIGDLFEVVDSLNGF